MRIFEEIGLFILGGLFILAISTGIAMVYDDAVWSEELHADTAAIVSILCWCMIWIGVWLYRFQRWCEKN